jgi:multidrug transporter EmrE-like cation transporter
VQAQVRPAQIVCMNNNALCWRKVPADPKQDTPHMRQRGRAQTGQRDHPAPRRRRGDEREAQPLPHGFGGCLLSGVETAAVCNRGEGDCREGLRNWRDATRASAAHYCLPSRRIAPPGGRVLGARPAACAARRAPVPGAAAGDVAAKTLAPPPTHGRDALGRSDRNDRGGDKCGESRAALRLRLCALCSRVDVFADFFARALTACRAQAASATGVPPPITIKAVVLLASCILLGVFGATFMRLSDGFKNVFPSVMIFVTYGASFVLFNMTLELWALSIAYAIWSGVGTALTAVVGVKLFKEKLKPINYWGFALIIAGVCAMNT